MIYNGYYWILMDYIWDYMGNYGNIWELLWIVVHYYTIFDNHIHEIT